MNLSAYCNIPDLNEIAKKNGIHVARLRGYELMRNAEPMSFSEQQRLVEEQAICEVERIFRKVKHGTCTLVEISARTNTKVKKYMDESKTGYERIRWERIHGVLRKQVKKTIRECKKHYRRQYALWNKYVGRDDVLYVHARLGSTSWASHADKEAPKHSRWFIAMVDDAFDSSYCDIYARIKPIKDKTDNQIIKWLKNPYSDSASYKMWGNGMALPNMMHVMKGIVRK